MRKLLLVALVWMGCGGVTSQLNTRRIEPPHDEGFTPWPTEIAHLEDATRLFAGAQPCVLRGSGEVACVGVPEYVTASAYSFAFRHADATSRDALGRGLKDANALVAVHARTLAEEGQFEGPRVLCPWGQRLTPFDEPILALAFHAHAARVEFSGGCAVVREGHEVACWGGDDSIDAPTITAMPEGEEAVEVSLSVSRISLACSIGCVPTGPHTCARFASGRVACWGDNTVGQLGDGTRVDHANPTFVHGIRDAQALVTGEHHNCVIRNDTSVWCWGYGIEGQLGDGAELSRSTPVHVSNIEHAVALSAGELHTCALDRDGRAFCWGPMNRFGMNETRNLEPVFLGAPERLAEIVAGDGYTCARSETGHVFCGGWY